MRFTRKSESGMSLLELMVGVGILGIVTYFVVETLKTGTLGQKQLQAQDDARTLTDNMVMILGSTLACQNTFINTLGVSNTFDPTATSPITVKVIEDENRGQPYVVTNPPAVYGNKSLKLQSIQIGGSGTDARTRTPLWDPAKIVAPATTPPSGTAFVEVDWLQTGSAANQSGPAVVRRYFLVNFVLTNGLPTSCSAISGGASNGYWSLASSGGIYNSNGNGSGNVGVGTGTDGPTGVFDVATNAGATHNFIIDAAGKVGVNPQGALSGLLDAQITTSVNFPGPTLVHSLLVTQGGLVGVWNASPGELLDIGADGAGNGSMAIRRKTGGRAVARFSENPSPSNWDVGMETGRAGFSISSAATSQTPTPNFYIDTTGNVGIGTASPGVALQVSGDVQATSFISPSDERLKTDVHPVEGLSKILQLRGVAFRWIKSGAAGMGVIAQEVEKIFPELVATDKFTGFKAVKYDSLIAPLIEAVKELYAKFEMVLSVSSSNSARIAALEASNARKDAAIAELRRRLDDQAQEMSALLRRVEGR